MLFVFSLLLCFLFACVFDGLVSWLILIVVVVVCSFVCFFCLLAWLFDVV